MKKTLYSLPIFAMVTLLTGPSAVTASTIISDDFGGSAGPLDGRVPPMVQTTGNAWEVGNTTSGGAVTDGAQLILSGPSRTGGFAKMALPFDDTGITDPIRLAYDFSLRPGDIASPRFYLGFGNASDDGATFSDYVLGPGFKTSGDWSGTQASLALGNGDAPDWTTTTTLTRSSVNDPFTASLSLVYDPSTQMVDYYVDATLVTSIAYAGEIGGLWGKTDLFTTGADTSGVIIDNLEVSTVPEPAMVALGFGLIAILAGLYKRRS